MQHFPRILAAGAVFAFATAAFAEQVDNPAYKAWVACKVGASVTRQTTQTGGGPAYEATVIEKLVKVTPQTVVIESTRTMKMAGKETKIPPTEVTIPAKVEKDQAGLPNQALENKPKVLGMKEGKETLDLKGKKIETVTRDFKAEITQDEDKMTVQLKTWFSPDIPGGMVKSVMTVEQPAKMTSTETVIDFSLAK